MEITPEQFATIEHCLPRQRGNVSLGNLQVVNAILYVAPDGHSKCSTYGQSNCSTPVPVN
jgi:hypothetical protein